MYKVIGSSFSDANASNRSVIERAILSLISPNIVKHLDLNNFSSMNTEARGSFVTASSFSEELTTISKSSISIQIS